jgi:hypothetical protein
MFKTTRQIVNDSQELNPIPLKTKLRTKLWRTVTRGAYSVLVALPLRKMTPVLQGDRRQGDTPTTQNTQSLAQPPLTCQPPHPKPSLEPLERGTVHDLNGPSTNLDETQSSSPCFRYLNAGDPLGELKV